MDDHTSNDNTGASNMMVRTLMITTMHPEEDLTSPFALQLMSDNRMVFCCSNCYMEYDG